MLIAPLISCTYAYIPKPVCTLCYHSHSLSMSYLYRSTYTF